MKPAIPLSPIDHVFLGPGAYPVQFAFYYRNGLDVDNIRASLQRIESMFWPVLRGRLELRNNRFFCVDSGQRIQVTEKKSNQPVPDFGSAQELAPFAIDIDLSNELAAIEVTQFEQGSLLSVNIAHCLVDGYSFFYFLSFWAQENRDNFFKRFLKKILGSPVHQRELTIPENIPDVPAFEPHSNWIFAQTGIAHSQPREGMTVEKCDWTQIELTKEDIRAQVGKSFGEPRELGVSWHDLISAIVWKRSAKMWPHGPTLKISSAFDFRRVHNKINHRYFGNAVRGAGLEMPTEEVVNSDLLLLSKAIRESTTRIDEAKVFDSLGCIEAMWGKYGEEFSSRMHVADPENGLLVTNLSRLPSSQLDFGVGKPELISALTPAPRTALITKNLSGSFQVRLSSPVE